MGHPYHGTPLDRISRSSILTTPEGAVVQIKLREIGDGGVRLELPLGRAQLKDALEGLDADLERSRCTATVTLTKTDDNVFLSGTSDGEVMVPCVRCLVEVRTAVATPLKMFFLPEGEEAAEDEQEDDVEYGHHDGVTLVLDDVLREALILAVPMNPLCKADCKGLCPVCGGDRNARDCGCAVNKLEDPRLAPLKGLKL